MSIYTNIGLVDEGKTVTGHSPWSTIFLGYQMDSVTVDQKLLGRCMHPVTLKIVSPTASSSAHTSNWAHMPLSTISCPVANSQQVSRAIFIYWECCLCGQTITIKNMLPVNKLGKYCTIWLLLNLTLFLWLRYRVYMKVSWVDLVFMQHYYHF